MEEQKSGESKVVCQLRKYLKEESEVDNFSGAVLVARNEETELQYASGFANKEKKIPNTLETEFNLGSVGKMFTAAAIAQLVEKGLLSFDDRVGKFLPDYPNQELRQRVTIHHLLTHTAGMGHYMKDREKVLDVREKLSSIDNYISLFETEPLLFEPGKKYQYSGNGYELLGAIIEAVSGKSYYDFVTKNIFRAAEMFNTKFVEIEETASNPNVAIGYKKTKESFYRQTDNPPENNLKILFKKGSAAGGVYSTVGDLLRFSRALVENRLLSPGMTKEITTPKVKVGSKDGQTLYYGYGFQIMVINGRRRIGHAGANAGVSARFDIYLKLGYTVIVLSNYDRPTAFRVAEKATELIIYG